MGIGSLCGDVHLVQAQHLWVKYYPRVTTPGPAQEKKDGHGEMLLASFIATDAGVNLNVPQPMARSGFMARLPKQSWLSTEYRADGGDRK